MKLITFISITLFLLVTQVFSQQQPNSGFESWSIKTLYEDPGNFTTTNLQSYFTIGAGNVTKTTQSQQGSYAVHLQTIAGTNENIMGGLFIGTPGPGGVSGGLPFNQKPVSLQLYTKYSIQPNDTANLIVMLKRNGAVMAYSYKAITGMQTNYSQITLPFTWIDFTPTHFPDTITAIFTSSVFNNNGIVGSEIYLDNLTFTGTTAAFPNGDFENWISQSYEEPDNWSTLNYMGAFTGDYSAIKTTDHYSVGNYALKIKTVLIPGENNSTDTMGFVSNGRMGNQGPRGGLAVNNYPRKISGFYKYYPVGPDTALAGAFAFGHNDFSGQLMNLDSNVTLLPSTSVYTYFEVNLSYQGNIPVDTLNISFASSNLLNSGNYVGAGSLLYVDEINIDYFPTTEKQIAFSKTYDIYPNPARDRIYFDLHNTDKNAFLGIYDAKGNLLIEKKISDSKIGLDITTLSNGFYFYKLNNNNTQISGKFTVIK